MKKIIYVLLFSLILISCDPSVNYFKKGNEYAEDGKYDKALEFYQKALDINPSLASVYYKMGIVYNDMKKYNEALECYEKTIEINPDHAYAYNNMGYIYGNQRKNDKAIECYEKAIEINPNDANAYYNLGYNYGNKSHFNKAKECYEKAIVINPNNAHAYYNLGIINRRKKTTAADNFYQAGVLFLKQNDRQHVLKSLEMIEKYAPKSELIIRLKNKLYE
ncbi:MAG: tetratricopeptide repeat protein [Candidatus Tenebribacter burtonii]|nr:tetratricopeptide repeat protein [Candidatus Tenebribacter burtonii]